MFLVTPNLNTIAYLLDLKQLPMPLVHVQQVVISNVRNHEFTAGMTRKYWSNNAARSNKLF
jgi:hypothetical protein